MSKRFLPTLAVAASLLSLLSTKLSAQECIPKAVQNGEEAAKKSAKPLTLQAALPTAEKAFAKEGVDADKYMLSKAIYLGDVRVSGSGDTRAPALQAAYQFALSNNVKLPAWVFTYTMVADFDITRNTAFSNMVIIFVGPNNQASIIGGAPPSSE